MTALGPIPSTRVFGKAFASHEAALAAAKRAALEQRTPRRTEMIEYETADANGTPRRAGGDRPRPMSRMALRSERDQDSDRPKNARPLR